MSLRIMVSRFGVLLLLLSGSAVAFGQIAITPSTFPSAAVEQVVGATTTSGEGLIVASAAGGTAPYNWKLVSGALPTGLTVAADVTSDGSPGLNGVLSSPGTFTYTLQVTDSGQPAQTATISYTTVVTTSPLSITPATLPGGVVNAPYSAEQFPGDSYIPAPSGGQGPYRWTNVSGTLPPGIVLGATTPNPPDPNGVETPGAFTGTPTQPGTYSFDLQVTDSSPTPLTATQTFALSVANIQTFPEPSSAAPLGITTGPDGALWYAEQVPNGTDSNGNSLYGIGRITTAGTYLPSYFLPQVDVDGFPTSLQAESIVTGSDGALWFSETQGYIGRITTSGVVVQYPIVPPGFSSSSGNPNVNGLTSGPDGAIWFTAYSQFSSPPYAAIGRIAIPGNTITYYPLTLNPGAGPQGIVSGPDGALWFGDVIVDENGVVINGAIGRITPDGRIAPPPGCSSPTNECPIAGTVGPLSLAVGSDGAIWFTDSSGQVGRITLDGKSVSLYQANPSPTGSSFSVGQIVSGSDGALWFTSVLGPSDQVERITTAGVVTVFSDPAQAGTGSGIALGPDGALWVSDGANINRLIPPLALACNVPLSLEVGSALPTGIGCPAFGGTPPYVYAISSGSLPPGLVLNPSTGAISGAPTTSGPYSFSVLASDSSNPAEPANQVFNVTVAPRPPLTFTCTFPAGAQATLPYTATCAAGGGIPPYTYSISAGALPTGLALVPTATGLTISGTPTGYGSFSFTVQAADSGTPQFIATQTQTAFPVLPPPLKISCNFSSKAEINVPYLSSCSAVGGVPPYTFTTTGTAVPSWLSPGATVGSFSGTPTAPAGISSFSIQVHDSGPPVQAVSTPVTLTVIPPKLGVMCDFSKIGSVGTPYSTTCVTTNGVPAYHFKVSSGTLPPGMALNASTGAVSGTPSASGVFPFTVQVTDADSPSQTAIQNASLNVLSVLLKITSSSLPDASVDLPYSGNPLAEGGKASYTWTVQTGSLPVGLSINGQTGAITGTPTASGPYSFTLNLTDSSAPKQTVTQTFTGTVSLPVIQDFTEYPIPVSSGASGITNGPDGALWFATLNQPSGNLIGRITTTGVITSYPAPNPLSSTGVPGGITTGPDGTLWFAEQSSQLIGQISTDGTFSIDYPVTTTTANPQQVTAGPDGAVWFTESGASQIGRISSSGVMLNEFLTATAGSEPSGIVVGPDNAIWFTETLGNKIGRLTTDGLTQSEYLIPTAGSLPTSITVGPDGALWFTEKGAVGKIGRITVTGRISEFDTPTAASGPEAIVAGADGSLYFTEATANQIGRITTAGVITEYPVPTALSGLSGLALGQDGNIWIAEGATNKIARFRFVTQLAFTCSLPGSTPVPLGTAFSGTCTASQGVAPYTYTVSKGSLPPGVTLDPVSGVLSGNVTSPGTFTFTVQAADSGDPAETATQTLSSFTVLPGPLSLTCSIPGSGQTGTPFSGNCSGSGGTAPYTYTVSSGALPGGLTLDPTAGAITGTPTIPGTFKFTVLVTDSSAPVQSATQSASVVIQLGGSTTGGTLFTLGNLPATQPPGTNLTNVTLQLTQTFPVPLQGTVALSFTPNPDDGASSGTQSPSLSLDGYIDPALQFVDANGNPLGLTYQFTIPAGSAMITLPAISPGTVAGAISLTITAGTAQPVTSTTFVEVAAPTIEAGSVRIANVTSGSFDVELVATDVLLSATQATFTFTPAPGASLQGLDSFTIDLSAVLYNWWSTTTGLNNGGVFSLTVPFPLTGPISAIDSVSVTVSNSIGISTPVSGKQ